MAFDQNSIPKDLRPINVARTVSEEPRIVPPPATTIIARNPEGFVTSSVLDGGSPESATVYYPSPVSDAGFVGVGYGNLVPPTVSQWGPRMLAPVSHPAFTPVVGFGYSPSPVVVNPRIASDITYSGMATGFPDNQNLSNQVGGSGMDLAGNDFSARLNFNPGLVSRVGNNAVDQTSIDTFRGVGYSPSSANRSDQMSEESGDDSVSGKKIKFLCSFGGKILPRPSDGKLRYVGGQTRIISVRRDVHFNEMVQKMMDTYGHPVVIKYQLPDEDLDALISVSCPDDLDIMLDEFEKLVERSSDSSAKLRLFLFSASELDPSGMVQFRDLHDSGQTYVDAVNGIIDGPRGPIARKESLESGTSMQNSDYGGSEPVDGSIHGQVDASAAQITTDILSPRENFGTPHDTASGRMSESSHHAILLDTSSVQLGFPVVKSGPLPPQTSYSQSKVEVQSSVPLTISNQQMGMQQPRTEFAQPKPHLQAYVDPRQEPRVDHVQYPPLLGFPNPQLLGTSRPMYAQLQVHENTAGVAPHQFVHSVHMTMGPPSPHVNMRPNEVQPLMQPRLDRYAEESTFGPRVVQLPPDQSYNSYHVEVPSPMVADRLGWHQVTPSFEHVFPAGGLVHHPQVKVPEKFVRVENCYMCQKALPHAHSDIVAEDQRDGGASPVSDTSLVYHSLHLEDNSRAQPLNRVAVSGALGEYVVEPGGVTQPGVLGHGGNQVRIPPSEATGMSRNLLPQQGNERLVLQEGHNPDHLRISALPDAIVRRVGEVQSPYNAVIGAAPQFVPDGAFQKHLMQVRSQATPYATQPLSNDISTDGGDASIQTSEHFLSPKEYSEKLSGMFSKDGASDTRISNHHLRPIDGNMGTLRLFSNDSCDTSDCSKSAGKEVGKVDNLDQKLQKVTGRGKMVVEMNQSNATEVPVCSSSQVLFVLNSRPLESVEGTKLPVWGNPDPFQQSKIGNNYLESDEIQYGKTPPYFGVEANHLTDGIPASAEQKADAALFRPNLVPSNVEATTNKNGDMQDSSSSLFSNQDPWNLHHDTHLMPPRTNELDSRKEAFPTGDPFVGTHIQNFGELRTATQVEDGFDQQLGNFNKDSNSEHVQSAKDSAGSAEEQIKQDLQAVAEGVAASVLQSATSSNPDSQEKNEPMSGASQEGDVGNVNVDLQPKTQIEEKRTKLPEKANLGFPVSASIGRLQIIKNSDLEELRELGSGTFGTVYHGKWKGTDVAIKRINDRCFVGKPSEQDRMREDFWNEAVNLADLHHPNVVAFYGVVLDGPSSSVATVTEYMVNGSLRNALQKNENSLDKRKLLLIAMDVAFGMEYLHGKNIVHFDLKSDNLLVNLRDSHRPICKVGDLGLSKVKCQTLISGGVRGTLPWMAPELLNGSSSLVSEKVDVFSFGIVLWELLTGEEPYTDLHYGAIIGGIVSNTLRPPIPEYCDREWKSLMERCWSSEPSERPSFTEIANELRSMASKTPPKGQNQQHSPAQK